VSFIKLVSELLFPPRCAACGKLMRPDPAHESAALCTKCNEAWQRELSMQCPTCFMEYQACRCTVHGMEKRGISAYVKLAPYRDGTKSTVTQRLVLAMKEHPQGKVFRHLAAELAVTVRASIEASERKRRKNGCQEPLPTVVTYLPRSKRAVARTGFDQARELARALAAETGYAFAPLLSRVRDGAPQKSLSRRERAANLSGAFAAVGNCANCRVLLVDDVVTTGAGMCECARMLHAAEIIAVSVAYTEKKRKVRKVRNL